MRQFAPVLATLLLCASAPAAERSAFGHFRYAVPPGWKEARYANGVVLSPTEVPKGQHLDLTLHTSKPAPATLQQALLDSWDDVCLASGLTKKRTVNNTPYDIQTEERTCFKGWKYIRAHGFVTANADQAEYYLNLTVIRVNDRIERIAVLSRMLNQNITRYCLYDFPPFQRAVNEFLFSIEFNDWLDEPVKPATLEGGGIIGAWNGIGLFGGQYKSAYAIFFSNGQVFYGSRFPHEGLHKFNTWLDAELVPRYWGTYTFANGEGTITMPTGAFPFKSTPAGLTLNPLKLEHKYVRLAPVDNATFAGTYAAEAHNVRLPTITFTADGRFDDQGALAVLDHSSPYPFKVTGPLGRGSYSVKDYTLLFSYDDGRQFLVAFPGSGYQKSEPSPPTLELSFNADVLKRQ